MFSISATIFSLETRLFADGLLHPQKYPETVIDIYGPETTAHIILQGINVGHTWFPANQKLRAFHSLFWVILLSSGEPTLYGGADSL